MMALERGGPFCGSFPNRISEGTVADTQERFARLLGRAAMDIWGDIPRHIQEALFETAMKGTKPNARSSHGCCMTVIRAPSSPRSLARNCASKLWLTSMRAHRGAFEG